MRHIPAETLAEWSFVFRDLFSSKDWANASARLRLSVCDLDGNIIESYFESLEKRVF